MNRFFTSDTHFGHENSIQYCKRPFKNREEMDKTMIDNWNKVVGNNDIVYHLGDFCLGCSGQYAYDVIKRLNGSIVLMRGSHDNNKSFDHIKSIFSSIHDRKIVKIETGFENDGEPIHTPLFLNHYNHRVWPLSHYNSWHLFGHSHGGLNGLKISLGKAYDVGVDSNDFTPVSEAKVIEIMNGLPDNFNCVGKKKEKTVK